MPKLLFYRQARRDGGIRTAIEFEDETDIGYFEPATEDSDPVLIWSVDVRCKGGGVPSDPERWRQWFLEIGPAIQAGLRSLAEELHIGMDINSWPIVRKVAGSPKRTRIDIVCDFTRRKEGIAAARILVDLADHWVKIVQRLMALAEQRKESASW